MNKLPVELQEEIMKLTDFETCVKNDYDRLALKMYNPKIHTWDWACKNGDIKFVKWLHKKNICYEKLTKKNKPKTNYDSMNIAVEHGYLEIVVFLHEIVKAKCTNETMDLAAANGHLDIVRYLYENIKGVDISSAICKAAYNGHLPIVEYLYVDDFGECASIAAVEKGHIEIIKFIHAQQPEFCFIYTINKAFKTNRPEIVDFLTSNPLNSCTYTLEDPRTYNPWICNKCDTFICEKCDSKLVLEHVSSFTCDICQYTFCECSDPVERENRTNTYCEDCAPQSVIDENEELEREFEEYCSKMRLNESQKPQRKNDLIKALSEKGLELRSDSKLCSKYINTGEGEIDEIVDRMCQMKYLFDYCDMRKVLHEVGKEYDETLDAGYIPDFRVFDYAEYTILQTTSYPETWPWLE